MKKVLILSLTLFVLFSFSAISLFAQGPTGTGALPTLVSPSPTPTARSTPMPTPAPGATPSGGTKGDADKALEVGQIILSDKSFAEKVLRILVVLNDGKLAGGDLGEVLNSWTIAVLTSLRDGAGGIMFPDFLADTAINKLSFVINKVLIALAILTIGLSSLGSMKSILDGSFSGKIALVSLLGLIGLVLFLAFQPNIYDLLAKGCKKVIWWLGEQTAVTTHPGEDPFTFLVTAVLSLSSSAIGLSPTKTLGQLILVPAITSISLFLLANTIWMLFLTIFGPVGMGIAFISGQRRLSGSFLVLSEIGTTFLNATIVYVGVLTLVIIATSSRPMAEPLLILGVGHFVLLVFVGISNLFLHLSLIFPGFKKLRVFEDNFIQRIQVEAGEVPAISLAEEGGVSLVDSYSEGVLVVNPDEEEEEE